MKHIGVKNVTSNEDCKCEYERTGNFLRFGHNNLVEVKCVHCGHVTYFGVNDLQRVNMATPENYLCLID